ncbi:hypothetical protein F443_22787, partial [Phytophthora nicotianae P1569]
MRPYSSSELAAAVRMETPCRGSAAAANSAVYRRDLHFFEVQKDTDGDGTNDDTDTYGKFLRGLNRAPSRCERRVDDDFQGDPVGRALVLLPPSVDDERLATRALAFAVSLLVFMLNLHWWSHVGSCFKKSRSALSGRCRYGYPRPRAERTCCSSDGVTLARRAPFEYVNGFNSEMMLAFKSNHDIQVMIGGLNALMHIYYATKYVTKMQEHVDSITAVALAAFQRRRLREARNEDTTAVERTATGRKRVSSLLFAITNRREIAGPLAALYVLRGSCSFMSTPCATLPLRAVLDELVDQSAHVCDLLELREHDSNITFRAASILDDYMFRPSPLNHFNLYEYVAKHFRRKRTQSSSEHVLFLPDHPLFDTHCVGTHVDEVVPDVVGFRMPYVDRDSPHELVVKRSQCALVLFKSFRTVSDLVTDPTYGACWIDAFSQWEPTRSKFTCEVMTNMDDYHRAAKQAKACAEACVDGVNGRIDSDAESDDDEIIGTQGDVDAALDRAAESASANPVIDTFDHFFDACNHNCINDDTTMDENTDESSLPVFPSSRQNGDYSHLLNVVANSTAGTAANLCSHNSVPNFSGDELQRFVKDTSKDEAEPQRSEQYLNERPTEVIELLKNALEPGHEWSPPTQPNSGPRMIRSYSSIDEVSRAFTLNQRQHAAFALITTALLRRFLQQEINGLQTNDNGGDYCSGIFENHFHDSQLLMFLGGAGGTGKSRVINAVDAFCESWHRSDTVVKTALTGKAATLIGGRTLASFMMRLKHAIREKHFGPLDLLVIDEISMMKKTEWLRLDKLLRCYKRMPDVPFGGVHIVLVGDFLQMPPVKADPIYIDPAVKRKPTTVDVEGFDLWRKFTTVVVLEESVRFRSDPEWGDGCRLARLGNWTPAFVKLINSRVVAQPNEHHAAAAAAPAAVARGDDVGAHVVFVTPENATRLAVNNAFVAQTAAMLPTDSFPVRVFANFNGALNGLSNSDIKYVFSLPDNRFGRMAPYLDLILGMPVQVTQNVATAKGVANGTLGTLESVHFPPDTLFRLVRDGGTNTIVQLPSRSPDYAVLRLPQRPHAVAIRPGLDPDLFPVFFATEAFQKATITLPKAPDGCPRAITVKPQQL